MFLQHMVLIVPRDFQHLSQIIYLRNMVHFKFNIIYQNCVYQIFVHFDKKLKYDINIDFLSGVKL